MLITLASTTLLLAAAADDGQTRAGVEGGGPKALPMINDAPRLQEGWQSHIFEYDRGRPMDLRVPPGGRDDARVPGVIVDVATGRRTPVASGHRVIVRGPLAHDAAAQQAARVRVVRELMPSIELVLVESALADNGEDAAQLAARLSDQGWRAYPDVSIEKEAAAIEIPPNDTRYPGQFYLEDIDIEDAWALSTGSSDVTILVADNGCDLVHPDLVAKLDEGFDPFQFDRDPTPEPGTEGSEHGTAVAGIVGAATDNNRDIAGTCPDCRIRCSRLLPGPKETSTTSSDVLTFQYALDVEADIVSNSWGFTGIVTVPGPLRDAIDEVHDNGRGGLGATVVFATGNDAREIREDELLAVRGVLGVGAVNNLGELTQFSNGGRAVDIVAPTGTLTLDISGPDGVDPGDTFANFGGTSSACPVVAGVIGLMLANDPSLTSQEVTDALLATARQSVFATPGADGHDDDYGYGLVQPLAAMEFVAEPPAAAAAPPPECACSAATTPASSTVPPGAGIAACAILVVSLFRRRALRSYAA